MGVKPRIVWVFGQGRGWGGSPPHSQPQPHLVYVFNIYIYTHTKTEKPSWGAHLKPKPNYIIKYFNEHLSSIMLIIIGSNFRNIIKYMF